MNNSEKKFEVQGRLFEEIRRSLPARFALVDEISEVLNISHDSAYRRIRCDQLLDIKELYTLSKHFLISLDSIGGVTGNQFLCDYATLDFTDLKSYLAFAQFLANFVDDLRRMPESELILTASEIQLFNFLFYKELTYFQLFSWNKSVCGYPAGYEEFVKELNTDELSKYYDSITKNFLLMPSTEIWTSYTMESVLRLLYYHTDMEDFSEKNTPLLICGQLLDMIDTLEHWAEKGTKGVHNVPFRFYVSEINLENTFMLFKNTQTTKCVIKIFGGNGLTISDGRFCQDTESWFQKLTQRSVPISGAMEKERFKFFNSQRQKVQLLIDKIKE